MQILARAQAHLRAGRRVEAVQDCESVLAINPRQLEALNLLAQLQAEQGNFAAALQLLGRSLTANPRQPYMLNVEGILLAQQKQYDDALRSLDHALLLKPDFAEAFGTRSGAAFDFSYRRFSGVGLHGAETGADFGFAPTLRSCHSWKRLPQLPTAANRRIFVAAPNPKNLSRPRAGTKGARSPARPDTF